MKKTFREIAEMHYGNKPLLDHDQKYRKQRINALEKLLTEQLNIGDVRLSLPDREQLLLDTEEYVSKLSLPQNDEQDWQEYEQAKMQYVLDLIYGKSNEA